MTEVRREPILRLMPGPADINANGHIFGGWVLSQMDMAAGIVARLHSGGPVATIAIDRMEFLAPIHLRDLISVYAHVESVGRTSMKVRIEVFLKPGVLDVQGKAIEGALGNLGFEGVSDVRVGRIVTLDLAAADRAAAEAQAKAMCDRLLANAVIESYRVDVD